MKSPIQIQINTLVDKVIIVGTELTDEQQTQLENQIVQALDNAVTRAQLNLKTCPLSNSDFADKMNSSLQERIISYHYDTDKCVTHKITEVKVDGNIVKKITEQQQPSNTTFKSSQE
jgi:hypothetical protein